MVKMKQNAPSELCLILVGEEWTGKSSAGNTVLGRTVFDIHSDTEHEVQRFGVVEGRNVTVVDTPGWDAECSPDVPLKILKKGHNAASSTCPGIHVLLLTINISQDRKWNQEVAQRLMNVLRLFSDDFWKHTMLLFTKADLLHSTGLEGYLEGSGQPFQSLLEKCERRYHVLDNHKQNDRKQVRELLEKIEQMVQENNGQSLQLVASEQEVGEHEIDNRQWVERCSKMEELIGRESCFRFEDYMFKSLRPQENDPPNLNEQREIREESGIYVCRSEGEMSHPVDVQDVELEYIHIQDEDTESTSDLRSGSFAETNRDVAMSSDDNGDTGMDQIPRDEEKDNKYSTLQKKTPHIWDNSWVLSITYYIYKDASNQQCVMTTCVLQLSVSWRKMIHETDWIAFTVCGDDINWLVFTVLCLIVRYLCLIYKTQEVFKETGSQNMNMLVSGFVEHQQEPSKENQGAFHPMLGQMGNSRPEKVNQWNKMEDEEIIQESMESKDEGLPKYIYKGEEEEEEEEEVEDEIIGTNEEIRYQSKRGDNKKIPQNDYNEDGDNILQLRQRVDDDRTLHHSIKEKEKQMIQNNKRDYEATDQQSNADEGAQILKLTRKNDDSSRNSGRYGGVKKKPRMTKMLEYENTLNHSRRGHNRKMDYEEIPQQSKRGYNEEIPQQSKRGYNEEIPQQSNSGYNEEILQQSNRGYNEEILQQSNRGYNEEILQQSNRGYNEEIPQQSNRGYNEEIPQQSNSGYNEEILQQSNRGYNEEIPQQSNRGYNEEIPQQSNRGYNEEIPQQSNSGYNEEIPQQSNSGYNEEIPQQSNSGYNEEILQQSNRGNNEEIPQQSNRGYNEEISQQSNSGYNEEIPQQSNRGYNEEIPQQSNSGCNEEIPQQSNRGYNEEIPQQSNRGYNEEISQQSNSGYNEEIPQQSNSGYNEEILQQSNRGYNEEIPQQSNSGYNEEIPQQSNRGYNEEILQQSNRGYNEEIPQQSNSGYNEEILQQSNRGYKEEIPQPSKRGYKEEIPQYNRRGDMKKLLQHNKKDLPHNNRRVHEKLIPQSNRLGDDKEIPQQNRGRETEDIPNHRRRPDYEHKRKGDDGDIYQHRNSAQDHENIPRHNKSGLDDEIPQRIKREDGKKIPQQGRKRDNGDIPQQSRKGDDKVIPQHTSVGQDEEIKEAPEVKIWIQDCNNHADTKNEDEDTNCINQVVRPQRSPEARAASWSRLNRKEVRKAENTMDVRRAEFEGGRKITRSQSMDLLISLSYPGEEDMRRHGGFTKIMRSKSLERFDVFKWKEEKTAENKLP